MLRWKNGDSYLLNKFMIKALFIFTGLTAVSFVLLPIYALFARAIRESAWQTASSPLIIDALQLSLMTTFISLLIILLIGTPLAYGLVHYSFRGQHLLATVLELPIVLPPAVAGLGLLMALGRQSFIGRLIETYFGYTIPFSEMAVIIAQVFVALPYYVRTAQVGFQNIAKPIEEAAQIDGADWLARLRFITLPLSRNALVSGMMLSWARALGEFGATILFAGNLQGVTQTLPLLIFSIFERDLNAAIWTSLILIMTAFLALFLARWLSNQNVSSLKEDLASEI